MTVVAHHTTPHHTTPHRNPDHFQGHEVIVIDNMFTGRKKNVAHWIGHPNFMLIVHDVVEPIMLEASPRPSLDTSKHVKG